jgi:hypothetical protein
LESLKREGISTSISAILKSPEETENGIPLFFDMIEDARFLLEERFLLRDFTATKEYTIENYQISLALYFIGA